MTMTFQAIMREYYLRCGYDYREASRHAAADAGWILNTLMGHDDGAKNGGGPPPESSNEEK